MTDSTIISNQADNGSQEGLIRPSSASPPVGRPMPQFGGAALLRSARSPADSPHQWPAMVPSASRPTDPDVDTSARNGASDGQHSSNVDTSARSKTKPARAVPPKRNEFVRSDVDTDAMSGRSTKGLAELPESLSHVEAMPAPARSRPMPRPGKRGAILPSEKVLEEVRASIKADMVAKAKADRGDHIDGTPTAPTRTPTTQAAYLKRGQDLIKRFRREREIDIGIDSFDAVDFATWCIGLRHTLKPSTWRQYRQSILAALNPIGTEKTEQAIYMIENADPSDVEMGTGDKRPKPKPKAPGEKQRKTSTQKRKYFLYADYKIIMSYLRLHRRSETSYFLSDWIDAGLMTGLRPAEWKATEYREFPALPGEPYKRAYLIVLNAKATNGRGNGIARTLDLTAISEGKRAIIERMSRRGREWFAAGKFNDTFNRCSQMLYEIGEKKLWSRRKTQYALYSCRHQFIANQHARGVPRVEVSAMVGHVVDETVTSSYAKGSSGWGVELVEVVNGVPEEIAAVRRIMLNVDERLRQHKLSKQPLSSPTEEGDVRPASGENLVADDPGR